MVSLAQRFQPVSFQAGGAGAPAAHALARRVRRMRSIFYYKIPQL